MPQAPIHQLAPELTDDIIDVVSALDCRNRCLKACALTCRAFRPRSQMHIFSRINFSSDIGKQGYRDQRIKKLLDILRCSTNIVNYVGAIHLSISSYDSGWIAEDPLFLTLMTRLNELGCRPEEFSTEGLDPFIPQAFPDTPHRPMCFYENVFRPFFAPYITSLRLSTVNNVPPIVISSCINLARLRLICTDLNTTDGQLMLEDSYPMIETLEFDRPIGAMKTILDDFEDRIALVDLSRLRVLRSTINSQNAPYVRKIIRESADYLEEARFCCSSKYGSFYYAEKDEVISPFDFSCVPRLRVLAVTMAVDTTPMFQTAYKIRENICTILKSIRSANIFERLSFCAYLDIDEFKSFFKDDRGWDVFDSEVIRVASGKPLILGFALHVLSSLPYLQGDSDEPSIRALIGLVRTRVPLSASSSNITLEVYTYQEHSL
ncbi:hypothetical protein CPB84DRAFT_1788112 [Gymnopilus junonius]|uniref:Uncharacterized protein n=1 Tax=Gymnopilus junonius TaxID=109634 RepID=A0A9P5NGY0_GYMJU|nr:hypothetical protein CPB84DRAFT_1788112 [Gymnopilus junonius]